MPEVSDFPAPFRPSAAARPKIAFMSSPTDSTPTKPSNFLRQIIEADLANHTYSQALKL